jgi:WD40 repeat protein/serine/threonine protein kinase
LFPALVVLEQAAPASDSESLGAGPASTRISSAGVPEELGDYRIVREIGRGGMGVVYEAEQQSLGRRVALKVLLGNAAQDTKMLARFRRESRAAAQLHHTNIVPVHEVGEEDGLCYYAMQFIRGQALDEVFRELQHLRASSVNGTAKEGPTDPLAQSLWTGKFASAGSASETLDHEPGLARSTAATTPRRAELSAALPDRSELSSVTSNYRRFCNNVARLGLQAAEALAYAHGRGVIHRDIKPANLLLDTTGVLWISDFGLAKTQDPALTETGDVLGTLRYMAPERFRGECDTQADVYALGLTLYELLVLRPAFDGTDRLRLVEQIGRQEPARLRILDPRIPRDLETIIMKAIEKDPRRRYPSAEAMAGDLRRFLADEPILARRTSPLERLGRWGRRNPLVAGLIAAVVLVTALGFAGVFGQMQQAQEQRDVAQQQRDEAQRRRNEVEALNKKLQATQDERRRILYAAHANLAQHAWKAGGVARMLELLEKQRPKTGETELRGFEWDYLYRLGHLELLTLTGHTGPVTSVTFSPDGKRMASSSYDHTTRVWDAQTGQELFSRKGGGNNVAFSPDGKRLSNGEKVWDAQTGQELVTIKGAGDGVTFSPDGKRLATTSKDDSNTLKVWDAQTGHDLFTIKGHIDYVIGLAFSPDGKRLASASADHTVKLWDAQTGKELLSIKHASRVYDVAFSPDGKRLASASDDGTVTVWDAQTGEKRLTIKGGGSMVVFSPDGGRLATIVSDPVGAVKVWDAQTGQELLTFRHSGGARGVAFSPDGKRLASAGSWDHLVKVWDAQKNAEELILRGIDAGCIAFSPAGQRLATSSKDNSVKVWDSTTGQLTLTLKGHTAPVTSVAFSPDGKHLASGAGGSRGPGGGWGVGEKDRTEVKVWDAQTGRELLALPASSGYVGGLAFSSDGKRLASASGLPWGTTSDSVKVWDAQTGQELLTLKGTLGDVAFSPDGKLLSNGEKVWDAQSGQELFPLEGGAPGVAISPDGKRLATGSWERGLRIWDLQTGQPIRTLQGHTSYVSGVAFSPDGRRLASTSGDKTVKVWDTETGQELLTLGGGQGPIDRVRFSPDGNHLAAATAGGTVTIWNAMPLPEKR